MSRIARFASATVFFLNIREVKVDRKKIIILSTQFPIPSISLG